MVLCISRLDLGGPTKIAHVNTKIHDSNTPPNMFMTLRLEGCSVLFIDFIKFEETVLKGTGFTVFIRLTALGPVSRKTR